MAENLSPIVADTTVRHVRWGCAGVAAESGTEAECGKLADFQIVKEMYTFNSNCFLLRPC
ncbi:MAG: hypothetical protein ABIP10_21795 [Ferruginibacter sp.]